MDPQLFDEIHDLQSYERVVTLSPHLDDAALSCYGLLTRAAAETTCINVTVCCGDATLEPPLERGTDDADALRSRLGPADRRREEDRRAMRRLGVNYVHLGAADALHRTSPTSEEFIYASPRGKFDDPSIDDATHIEELFVVLRRICQNMGDTLLAAPLGIGYHIDHAIAAHVALRLRGQGLDVLFYEDFPYCIDATIGTDLDDSPTDAADRLGETLDARLAVPVAPYEKIDLLETYDTQFPVLFADVDDPVAAIEQRTLDDQSVEYLWQLA